LRPKRSAYLANQMNMSVREEPGRAPKGLISKFIF